MNYECTLTSVDKLMLSASGVRQPLCSSCAAPDCSNPIRERTVSVMGKAQKMRLYVIGNVVKQVVACEGYVGDVATYTQSSFQGSIKSIDEPHVPSDRDYIEKEEGS